jgi:uncharacterized repeat protein (TIGR03943 family)
VKRSPTIVFLLGLAVFIIVRLATGQILLYLRAPMTGLLCATIFFLLLIVWSYGMQPEASPHTDQVDGDDSHDAHDHEHVHNEEACACGHGHGHDGDSDEIACACGCEHGTTWLKVGLMALPFVIGLLIPPQPLASSAMSNRSLNRVSSRSTRALPAAQENRADKNLYQWAMYLNDSGDPASVSGQAVRVTGFVYRDTRCGSNTFVVARFVMMCCAADASPVGFPVQWPDAVAFKKDEWVTVTGHFGVTILDKTPMPIINADSVQAVESPARPYLSPWGP